MEMDFKMTRRAPNLKLLGTDMQTSELPATLPAIVESDAQRLTWTRDIQNARDERALIDEQIQSAERICGATKTEAVAVRDARINYANQAMDREYADADKILAATATNLRHRQADLDRVIKGLSAAVDASGEDKPDGVSA